ncbi:acetate and sugar kinases/Hsc70/actin family protein [Peribacillus glennii]|uniref:Uncharacterized protein n=1 Tax=Peribacillus glennii TaxID=2303991 RepID=A0A372LBX8_9BACI|nr:hypothetical protein [Peribacillus glennii]RFU63392.1 hypothetical protein D0466_11670 [Peribacillus glennii]
MDLDTIWASFINTLAAEEEIVHAAHKKVAGIPFLYVKHSEQNDIDKVIKAIKKASAKSMRGHKLHSVTVFVRSEKNSLVFRHRFFVPQKKMFCCGNLCPDCIRFENES